MATQLEQRCEMHGIMLTGKRRVILQVIEDAADHPDAEEIHRRVVAYDSRISIGTVYRTIRLFEMSGIVRRIDFGNGRGRYESAARAQHHHLIDLASGAVLEFSDPQIDALYGEIAQRLGYRLMSRELKLYCQPTDRLTHS